MPDTMRHSRVFAPLRLRAVLVVLLVVLACSAYLFTRPRIDPDALYVAPYGDDAHDGSADRPFRTLRMALRALPSGGTLYMRAGTYPEAINNTIRGGSPDDPTVVAAYPGETVRLYPPESAVRALYFAQPTSAYIVVDGLTVDAARVSNDGVKIHLGAHHITLQNTEIRGAPGHGVHISRAATQYNHLIDVYIHHNGIDDAGTRNPYRHGVYIQSSANAIIRSRIAFNGGNGVQIRRQDDAEPPIGNSIRDSVLTDHDRGVVVLEAVETVITGNIIERNRVGVQLQIEADGAQVWHNIINANETGIGLHPRAHDSSIIGNVIIASRDIGVSVPANLTFAAFRDNVIVNNQVNVPSYFVMPGNRIGS
jgi:nitrous oxidase accessory protein NosD